MSLEDTAVDRPGAGRAFPVVLSRSFFRDRSLAIVFFAIAISSQKEFSMTQQPSRTAQENVIPFPTHSLGSAGRMNPYRRLRLPGRNSGSGGSARTGSGGTGFADAAFEKQSA